MDTNKLIKLNSAELEKEISVRQKKIKTLKSEIALLEKLKVAENAKNTEGQQAWQGIPSSTI